MLGKAVTSKKSLDLQPVVLAVDGAIQSAQDNEESGVTEKCWRIPVLFTQTGSTAAVRAYCESVSTLLHGQMVDLSKADGGFRRRFNRVAREHDLVLVAMPERSILERFLFDWTERRPVCHPTTTVLVVQSPRWPIRKILLVLRVQPQEAFAVDWAGRMSRLCGADLTIQPLIPEQPLVYGPGSPLHVGIDTLLMPGTHCGEQLRSFLDQLQVWQVQGTLRVRQGDLLWQVRTETEAGEYDLVIIGAEPHSRLRRWFAIEFVGPLVSMVNRPVLVVSARKAAKSNAKRSWTMNEALDER